MQSKLIKKDEYLNSIKSLKEKYKDVIEIETGFEIEYLPGQEKNLFELKNETERLYKSEGRNPQFIVLVYNQIY